MADISANTWNENPDLNNAPPPNGLPSGSLPNQLAPIVRDAKAAVKRFYNQINAMTVSSGTGAAYILTYQETPEPYRKGIKYAFFAHAASAGPATLNINGLGAKSILTSAGDPIVAGQIGLNQSILVVYDGTSFRLESANTANPKFTGVMTIDGSLEIKSDSPVIRLVDTTAGESSFQLHANQNNFFVLADRDKDGTVEEPHPLQLNNDGTGYIYGSRVWTEAVAAGRSIVAGPGLSGGGNLGANVTVSMGQPGTISTSTGNAVASGTHTHALTLTQSDIINSMGYTPLNKAGDRMNGTLTFGSSVLASTGDITLSRSAAPTTGALFFGNASNRYLFYDGTTYNFAGATVNAPTFNASSNLTAGGTVQGGSVTSSGNISAAGVAYVGNGAAYVNTDGNIWGPRWGSWGTNWAFDAINAQIERRAGEHAVYQVSLLESRLGNIQATYGVDWVGSVAWLLNSNGAPPNSMHGGGNLWYSDDDGYQGNLVGGGSWRCYGHAPARKACLYRRAA